MRTKLEDAAALARSVTDRHHITEVEYRGEYKCEIGKVNIQSTKLPTSHTVWGSCEPEDANWDRNLSDVFDIGMQVGAEGLLLDLIFNDNKELLHTIIELRQAELSKSLTIEENKHNDNDEA